MNIYVIVDIVKNNGGNYKVKLTLDKILEEKHITKYQLEIMTGIQYKTIDRYFKNKNKRYDSYILSKFCDSLNCDINDIIVYIKD